MKYYYTGFRVIQESVGKSAISMVLEKTSRFHTQTLKMKINNIQQQR